MVGYSGMCEGCEGWAIVECDGVSGVELTGQWGADRVTGCCQQL